MTSKRRDCRLIMCTTVLHGGVSHRTSTPHKSGNKMKEKKKTVIVTKVWTLSRHVQYLNYHRRRNCRVIAAHVSQTIAFI